MFNVSNYAHDTHKKLAVDTHWRAVYKDGNFIEDQKTPGSNAYSKIDRKNLESMCIIDSNSGKELMSVQAKDGYNIAYRLRNRGGRNGVECNKILVLVKKNPTASKKRVQNPQTGEISDIWFGGDFDQEIHMLHPDGEVEVFSDPDDFRQYGRIFSLRDEEVS